jgi:hypothetical protein
LSQGIKTSILSTTYLLVLFCPYQALHRSKSLPNSICRQFPTLSASVSHPENSEKYYKHLEVVVAEVVNLYTKPLVNEHVSKLINLLFRFDPHKIKSTISC